MRHAHIGICQLSLVNAVKHVRVGCASCEDFGPNLFDRTLLALLVDVVNLCQTLELQRERREGANEMKFPAESYLIKNSSLSTGKKRPET